MFCNKINKKPADLIPRQFLNSWLFALNKPVNIISTGEEEEKTIYHTINGTGILRLNESCTQRVKDQQIAVIRQTVQKQEIR